MEGYLGPFSKRPAYDIVAQAMGGLMHTCGQAGGPPTWLGVALGDIVSGMNAAYAIMLALFQRAATGRGQYIDVSMYDTIIGLAERSLTAYSLTGTTLERGRELYMAPWGPFECSDGWVALIVATERDWGRFCEAIGRPELVDQEGATSGPERAQRHVRPARRDHRRVVQGPDEGRGRGDIARRRAARSARCRTRRRSTSAPTSRLGRR